MRSQQSWKWLQAHILDSVKEVVPTFIEKDYNFNEINSYSNAISQDVNHISEDDGFDSVVDELVVEDVLQNESIADEKIDEMGVISEDLEFNHDSVSSADSEEIPTNSQENSDEEKSFAELVEEISASYEEDSDGTDLSEDENNQIIELESDSEAFDDGVVFVESDSEAFDDGVVFVESGDEGIIEEEIVYVDEDGNEIVFEEGVVYVDSEGNEITFDNENGIKTISDDDFIDLDDETFEIGHEELDKYNDILEECVGGYEESLDEEFSKVYKESDDSENGEES